MLDDKDPQNIIITGVGGQGNVLASQIIGNMAIQEGRRITIGETYGVSQRGGSVMSHLRISRSDWFSPLIPEGQCDLVVGLEPTEALRVLGHYGNPNTLALVNTRPLYPIDVISGHATYPDLSLVLKKISELIRRLWILNATEIALQMGNPIFSNIVMIGALSSLGVLSCDRDAFQKALEGILPGSKLADNLRAFDQGRSAVRELTL